MPATARDSVVLSRFPISEFWASKNVMPRARVASAIIRSNERIVEYKALVGHNMLYSLDKV